MNKEWEKAARGGDGRIYPWGNEFSKDKCNSLESGYDDTTPVDKYPVALAHMAALIWLAMNSKWIEDWSEKPRFSSLPSEKINRGGSFNRPKEHTTCSYIESDPPYMAMRDWDSDVLFPILSPEN